MEYMPTISAIWQGIITSIPWIFFMTLWIFTIPITFYIGQKSAYKYIERHASAAVAEELHTLRAEKEQLKKEKRLYTSKYHVAKTKLEGIEHFLRRDKK